MAALLLTVISWCILGWAVSRYIFWISDGFTLLAASLGTGLVLHTALLNGLLYVVGPVTGYWLGLAITVSISAGLYMIYHRQAAPIEMGISWPALAAVTTGVFLLWLTILPPLLNNEYFDREWHLPTAALIGSRGLPIRMPFAPNYCLYYHYGANMLAGTIFRVGGSLSLSQAMDWTMAMAVFSVLSLAANIAWKIRPSVLVALLAAGLLLFTGTNTWLGYLFKNEAIHDATDSMSAFAYFDRLLRPDLLKETAGNKGFPLAIGYFMNTYSHSMHAVSVNFGFICVLLPLIFLRSERRSLLSAVVLGMILGTLALYTETIWPVPAGLIGLYGLYVLYHSENRRPLLIWGTVLFAVAGLLLLFQGGAFTDSLFCKNFGSDPNTNESLNYTEFPTLPGYYSWLTGYVEMWKPVNWVQVFVEWGFLPFLFPLLVRHYLKTNRQPLVVAFLLASLVPVLILLVTNMKALGVNSGRVAVYPMMLWTVLLADWFLTQFRSRWWRRGLALLLLAGLTASGLQLLYGQFTYEKKPEEKRSLLFRSSFLDDIDRQVSQEWYAELGDEDFIIFDTTGNYEERKARVPGIFGYYTLGARSRADFEDIYYRDYLLSYPDPRLLHYVGIDYIYYDEDSWFNTPVNVHAMLLNSDSFERVLHQQQGEEARWLFKLTAPAPDEYPEYFAALVNGEVPIEQQIELELGDFVEPDAFIFIPRDNYGFLSVVNLPQIQTSVAFDLSPWSVSKLPQDLPGVDYLFVDDIWFGTLTLDEQKVFYDPHYYKLLRQWKDSYGRAYRLYRVN